MPSAANLLHEKKGLGKSGGPSLKGKGGLVGFRRSLKVQGRTGGFSKVQGRTGGFSKDPITFIFPNVNKVLVGFQKTSLNAKVVFRKPFLSPISLKNSIFFNYK